MLGVSWPGLRDHRLVCQANRPASEIWTLSARPFMNVPRVACARKRAHRCCPSTRDHAQTRTFVRVTESGRARAEVVSRESFGASFFPRSQRGGREFEPPAVHHLILHPVFPFRPDSAHPPKNFRARPASAGSSGGCAAPASASTDGPTGVTTPPNTRN